MNINRWHIGYELRPDDSTNLSVIVHIPCCFQKRASETHHCGHEGCGSRVKTYQGAGRWSEQRRQYQERKVLPTGRRASHGTGIAPVVFGVEMEEVQVRYSNLVQPPIGNRRQSLNVSCISIFRIPLQACSIIRRRQALGKEESH